MELKFQKRSLKILRRAAGEVQNQEQTLEVRLSDGMPDIGRVLASWGQVILRGKEWRRGSISCSGGVQAWTLYAPEDGSDVRCVESWLPFQMNWTMPEEEQDGDIRIQCLLRFVDARSVSARKLMLRAGIAAFGEGYVPEEREVSVPGEVPEDVQLLKASYPVRLYKEAGERAFNLDEDLTMPGSSPVPSKLIYCTMQPEITERRVSGNRVAFRGNGNLHLLYRSQEGQLHGWDFELPFSMLGELKQTYGADAQAQVDMAVTDLELVLDGEGHFRLKCGLLGQYLVSDREMIEIVEDAYSTGRPLEPEWETLELPSILDSRMENLYAELEKKVEFFFDTPVETVKIIPGGYSAVCKQKTYSCEKCIVSVGRSGSKWMEKICAELNIPTQSNRVDIGVRVELPAEIFEIAEKC